MADDWHLALETHTQPHAMACVGEVRGGEEDVADLKHAAATEEGAIMAAERAPVMEVCVGGGTGGRGSQGRGRETGKGEGTQG